MAGKLIAAKTAAITGISATGYITIASTTGWYVGAKGALNKNAVSTLTATGNLGDTETVTIGTKVYTFQTVLTDVDGHVLIGATASDSLDNLIAAINLGAGSGTLYATSTTKHTQVTAAAGAGDTMVITAIAPGTAGNLIATTETAANASWTGLVMAGGATTVSIVITEIKSATELGVRIVSNDLLGQSLTAGPDYGRSDPTAYNSGTVYQWEGFVYNNNDLPLS